jgi:hypothetical protein
VPTLAAAIEAANVPVQAATIPSGATVSNVRTNSDGSISEAASFSNSNISFNNTFASGVSQAFINCALAAEQTIANQWSTPSQVTLNASFTAQAEGQNGQLPSNGFCVLGITYATLKSSFTTHRVNPPIPICSRPLLICLRRTPPAVPGSSWPCPTRAC